MYTLEDYGWNDERAAAWQQRQSDGTIPARVIADFGRTYKIVTPDLMSARISGHLEHTLKTIDMPKIGDWVVVQIHGDGSATIQGVLPRATEIVRGQAGRLLDKQVVAANVDLAFVMQPLNHDFSIERLERYIFQLNNQKITTVILLNKADTSSDAADRQAEIAGLGVESIILSATKDPSVEAIESLIEPGMTAVIMGSSGAGKSTLTNRLLGSERQATAAIRERDSKGRHTTVHRELFLLPGGGMMIDTPGIRELQLWGDAADLDASFPEVAAAANQCRFTNCTHTTEDGCAIQAGLSGGTIESRRFKAYLNFKKELETLEARRNFIEERRSQQTKESAKRRNRRAASKLQDEDLNQIRKNY